MLRVDSQTPRTLCPVTSVCSCLSSEGHPAKWGQWRLLLLENLPCSPASWEFPSLLWSRSGLVCSAKQMQVRPGLPAPISPTLSQSLPSSACTGSWPRLSSGLRARGFSRVVRDHMLKAQCLTGRTLSKPQLPCTIFLFLIHFLLLLMPPVSFFHATI